MGERESVFPMFPVNSRLEVEELLGSVIDNAIVSKVSPYKLSVYELCRLLHEQNEGPKRFEPGECMNIDLAYSDVKRAVRALDNTARKGIYDLFCTRIQDIVDGNDQDVRYQDMLANSTVTQRPGAPEQMKLFAHRSNIGLWIKKLVISWDRLTTMERFNTQKALRAYIVAQPQKSRTSSERMDTSTPMRSPSLQRSSNFSPNQRQLSQSPPLNRGPASPPRPLKRLAVVPPEIESSSKARIWIDKQLRLLQVCPSSAVRDTQLYEYCSMIKMLHADISHVHLLEMILYFRMKNPYAAHEALRRCFDYGMFRPNTEAQTTPGVHNILSRRMGQVDSRSLRYGPLMHARLHRIFGERRAARALLAESVQHAQMFDDRICLRLVLVELAALDSMPLTLCEKKSLENSTKPEAYLTTGDVLKMLDKDFSEIDSKNEFPTEPNADDLMTMQSNLTDTTQLVSIMAATRAGILSDKVRDSLSTSISCTAGDDHSARARLISDATSAVASSIKLSQGLWRSTRAAAAAMIESNTSDGIAPHHETEAYAIAGVNIAYSLAAEGEWSAAHEAIVALRQRFPPICGWQCESHILICTHLLRFDDAFRIGDWKNCEQHLIALEALNYQEAILRRSLLQALLGRFANAQKILDDELIGCDGSSVLLFHIRAYLQLAMLHMAEKCFDEADNILQHVLNLCSTRSMPLFVAMAKRRQGVLHLVQSVNVKKAFELFAECEEVLCSQGTQLELGLLYLGWAKVEILEAKLEGNSTDKKTPERHLALARVHLRKAGYPILEKIVLRETALWLDKIGDRARRDDATEQFCTFNEQYLHFVDWTLF